MEKKKKLLVLIDGGHGADEYTKWKCSPAVTGMGIETDASVFNGRFREGNFNRLTANKLAELINSSGENMEAIILVPERKDVGLTERVRRANNYCKIRGAANVLLVSIHSNAAGNGSDWRAAQGWLSLVDDAASEKSRDLADMLFDEVKARGFKTRQPIATRKWWYYKECMGKPVRLAILKGTQCPAVLTENFFYTDKEEVKFLASEQGRRQVAEIHFEAIKRYVKKYF